MSPKISSVKSVWTNREARTWIVLTLTFGALIALLVNAVVATTDTSPSSDVVITSTLAL